MAGARIAFDIGAALDRLGGDEELLKEVGIIFLQESATLLQEVRAAVELGDSVRLERSAHSLKGSIANFGNGPAFDCARHLEMLGRSRRLDDAAATLKKLDTEVAFLQQEVRGYCR